MSLGTFVHTRKIPMSRPFSPLAIIRAVPRTLLLEYCQSQAVPVDPRLFVDDFSAEQVLAVCRGTPPIRPRFDAALREVHEMATEEGTLALVEEGRFQRIELPPAYHDLHGPAARAMWFLTHLPDVFHSARLLYAADNLPARHSTAVSKLPPAVPPHSVTDLGPFRRAVAEYYQVQQLRGHRCHIDPLLREGRLLLFVRLDDHPAVDLEFDQQARLQRRPHMPTFEVIFQFAAPTGTLSVYAHGRERVRIELLELFCRHLLGVDKLPEVVRRPAFRLEPLMDRDVVRVVAPAVGASGTRVRRLRVELPDAGGAVILIATKEGAWDDVHRMLDRHVPADLFPRDELHVSTAGVTVGYTREGKDRTLTFEVTRRGTTDLASRPDDQQDLGERLLRSWGVFDA